MHTLYARLWLQSTRVHQYSKNDSIKFCTLRLRFLGKWQKRRRPYHLRDEIEGRHQDSIINYLRQKDFKKFILWGRSMGATSALLYCLKYNPEDVLLQIIDSPFYSFQMIAFEIASKNVKAPQFIISFALQMAKKNCNKFQYNPFQIDLQDIGQCQVPALFLYCQEDSVINCHNTHLICSKYKGIFEKLVIDQNHNTIRSQGTLAKIFQFIERYSKKSKTKNASNLSDAYLDYKTSKNRYDFSHSRGGNYSKGQRSLEQSLDKKNGFRKGIERVDIQNKGKKFDDYGIWVASKFKDEGLNTPVSNQAKRKSASAKRPHLSLSNSFAGKKLKQFESVLSPSSLSKQPSSIYQFSAKTMASEKEKSSKKIQTVKSFASKLPLHNSKYL